MKKNIIYIALVFVIFAFANSNKDEFTKESLSKKLISFDKSTISFEEILKKHTGKVTVIEVWASWCSDCVKSMPKIKETQNEFKNVDYIFISMDKSFELWHQGIEKHELKGEHYWVTDGMKGEFGKSIDLDWIPRYIILDKNGKIITYRAIETDFDQIHNTLKTIL
jgi:thiol-disulfide isomerase/thioredoxin